LSLASKLQTLNPMDYHDNYHDKVARDAEDALNLLTEAGIDCQLVDSYGDLELLINLSSGVSIRIGCDTYEQLVFTIED